MASQDGDADRSDDATFASDVDMQCVTNEVMDRETPKRHRSENHDGLPLYSEQCAGVEKH